MVLVRTDSFVYRSQDVQVAEVLAAPLPCVVPFVRANRYGILDVPILDERHFRALRGPHGQPFRLVPAYAAS